MHWLVFVVALLLPRIFANRSVTVARRIHIRVIVPNSYYRTNSDEITTMNRLLAPYRVPPKSMRIRPTIHVLFYLNRADDTSVPDATTFSSCIMFFFFVLCFFFTYIKVREKIGALVSCRVRQSVRGDDYRCT